MRSAPRSVLPSCRLRPLPPGRSVLSRKSCPTSTAFLRSEPFGSMRQSPTPPDRSRLVLSSVEVRGKGEAMAGDLLLGVDIGTYSSKGVLCTPAGEVLASETIEHGLSLPKPGWAEH